MAPPMTDDSPWRKSSFSNGANNCVEMSDRPEGVAIRDSKRPEGPVIEVTRAEWRAFVDGIKGGRFDLPT